MVLRGHRHADIDAVLAQCQDPAFERWTTVPWPYLRSHAEEFVATREQAWTAGRYLAPAVEVDGRFAGTVDVRPDGTGAAEVGYGLAGWARGRGLTGPGPRRGTSPRNGWRWRPASPAAEWTGTASGSATARCRT
jgi:RimJ/RimL family protein N-acetyltransferase